MVYIWYIYSADLLNCKKYIRQTSRSSPISETGSTDFHLACKTSFSATIPPARKMSMSSKNGSVSTEIAIHFVKVVLGLFNLLPIIQRKKNRFLYCLPEQKSYSFRQVQLLHLFIQ